MPKISIIMPCLNSAQFIAEAIDSILGQTFKELELIVVDSGSTDGTLNILNRYAGKDARVQVVNCDKKSMGAQYNVGLDRATSAYIGFVESDDYIDPNTYDILIRTLSANDVDYVKSNFDMFVDLPDKRVFFQHGPIAENQCEYYGKAIGAQMLCELIRRDIFIWNGLYKRDFIESNRIRFNETPGAAFQDAGFASQALMYAKRAVYLEASLYRYRKGNVGASSSCDKTHEFVMAEFAYIMEQLNRNEASKQLMLPAFLRRFFGSFHNCLHPYLHKNGYTAELKEKVDPFRQLFKESYQSLTFSQRSWSDLWPPQDLALFFEDLELYCTASLARYFSDISANMQAANYLSKQSELIICGIGENSASVYCYLSRFGLQSIVGFCSDIPSGRYYGKEVLSAEAAANLFPKATFVITQNLRDKNGLKHQLCMLGINLERIVCYGAGLFHHNWHEFPIE